VKLFASTPPKRTDVAPVKFVPKMVIAVPVPVLVGVKLVIVGGRTKVKPAKEPVPPVEVTEMLPVAPVETVAIICDGETTVKLLASTPPKRTALTLLKFAPRIETVSPGPADGGTKLLIAGAGIKVKPASVTVPPVVETETLPLAPAPTTAFICVGETTVKLLGTIPPKLAAVAPVRFVPTIVTIAPAGALVGEKLVIVGGATNEKPLKTAVPPGVVTDTTPLAPPAPTTAFICVAETTVYELAATPPKFTAVAPLKPVPVIVTTVPMAAKAGVNDVIVGTGGINVKPARLAVPPGVLTDTLPDAPVETVAAICVAETTVKLLAGTPPKLTAVAPDRFVPIIEIIVPGEPLVGVKLVTVGGGTKVKPPSVEVPPGVVTETLPLAAPAATTAVICVAEITVKLLAATPPKLTAVAPVKPAPVMVTVSPGPAPVGENDVIIGPATKVKPVRVPVPPGDVTAKLPLAPEATTAVIRKGVMTVKLAAAVPPNVTAVAPVKLLPLISTVAPAAALVGVKLVIFGGDTNVNPPSVPVPPGPVAETLPLALPAATTAVICVAETTVKLAAGVPPKLTAVTPVKLVPVSVTVAPTAALVGVKLVIFGGGINVNPANVPVPPGVVTATAPVAPAATTAIICVEETTLKLIAGVPPKATAVAPLKFVPVIVTVAPCAALVGVNAVTVGGGIKVNPACVTVPPGVVTETAPLAPAPTTAFICVAETTVKLAAAVPPKLTALTPIKFVPLIVTVPPAPILVGVNVVIVGMKNR